MTSICQIIIAIAIVINSKYTIARSRFALSFFFPYFLLSARPTPDENIGVQFSYVLNYSRVLIYILQDAMSIIA